MDIQILVQETFDKYHRSVAMITREMDDKTYSTSTGFVIGRKKTTCLVMTCRHCVISSTNPSDSQISVRMAGKSIKHEAKILYEDFNDLAIVQVINVPEDEDIPVLRFRKLQDTSANTLIIQLGYLGDSASRMNLEPSVSPGTIIKSFCPDGIDDLQHIVYTSYTKHGCSGSPVLMDFEVIGILATMSITSQVSFAVSSNMIDRILRKWLSVSDDTLTIEQLIESILENI